MHFPIKEQFRLTDTFIEKYKNQIPPFGFNGLGEFVFMRTYSRSKADGKNEAWWETVRRVVEGIYSIQKQHIVDFRLGWNNMKAQKSAQEMFDRIYNFKMLPAGRSLWAMGSPVIMEKGLTSALYNCSFLSTENIQENPGKPFANAMDFLMCGVGVGADVLGANRIKVKEPGKRRIVYQIPDTREGWVESLELLVNSFFGENEVEFNYASIRQAGEPIKTFGGISSGPAPLKELHEKVREILTNQIGEYLSVRNITDIFNLIGKAVIAGNVRRSAEIILGNSENDFLDLKNYEKNPDRMDFGWASNNSIFAEIGMNYYDIAKRIAVNGEPGISWLESLRKYGRMKETEADWKDKRIGGLNPCGEIGLESSELCNLVELFPTKHDTLEDFKTTIKFAYLYAKTITLLSTPQWEQTNRVMLRNRRIGLSMTGLAQFIAVNGIAALEKWMEEGYQTAKYYDDIYSDWFAIPRSIKLTTIKPSGTISLLAGVTPGIHYPESKYYIRRVRVSNNSPFISVLDNAGYHIEPAIGQEETTSVIEFPICVGENIRTLNDVSMWEQLNLAAFAQEHWSDNSVSVTVTFKKEEEKDIENALNLFQFKLKAVSFLPKLEVGAYQQMPYEEITKEKYEEMSNELIPLDFSQMFSYEAIGEKYCSNDGCSI